MIRRTYDTSRTVLPCTDLAPIRIVKAPSLWTANPTATTTPARIAHTSQLTSERWTDLGQGNLTGFDRHVNVVAHQPVGIHVKAIALPILLQSFQIVVAVSICSLL
jgi:hypothetical protein